MTQRTLGGEGKPKWIEEEKSFSSCSITSHPQRRATATVRPSARPLELLRDRAGGAERNRMGCNGLRSTRSATGCTPAFINKCYFCPIDLWRLSPVDILPVTNFFRPFPINRRRRRRRRIFWPTPAHASAASKPIITLE